jgi:protein-L-isoaspartate(D-aspartate) O-methyltransferase
MINQKEKLLVSLKNQGFSDEIIMAFAKVDRIKFVPTQVEFYAYEDIALPLNDGSKISQPSAIAKMLTLLEPKQGNRILEIGSGSGYVLSIISNIIKDGKIFGMEINKNLAIKSKKILERDNNIDIISRNGVHGLPEQSPFDRIIVSAAFPDRNIPYSILDQLKDPGIMIAPVNSSILKIKKENGKISEEIFEGYTFVPFKESTN